MMKTAWRFYTVLVNIVAMPAGRYGHLLKNLGWFFLPIAVVYYFMHVAARLEMTLSDERVSQIRAMSEEESDFETEKKLEDAICPYRLGPTRQDDLDKIDSYTFPGIELYLEDLFPDQAAELPDQQLPVFVMGFSSNHFEEGMEKIAFLNNETMIRYKDIKVIFYDIGLTKDEFEKVKDVCDCEMRKFPFDKFPPHVKKNLNNYAWKSLIVKLVLKEYRFVVWMDTSHRFKTHLLDDLFAEARQKGIMVDDKGKSLTETIPARTRKTLFDYLGEHPCTFRYDAEKQGGFLLFYNSPFVTRYFLRPLVSCALAVGCMDPVDNSWNYKYLLCPHYPKMFDWHRCHRFDQSMIGILYTRLFHGNFSEHAVDHKYFHFH